MGVSPLDEERHAHIYAHGQQTGLEDSHARLLDLVRARLAKKYEETGHTSAQTESIFAACDVRETGFVGYAGFRAAMSALDLGLSDQRMTECAFATCVGV